MTPIQLELENKISKEYNNKGILLFDGVCNFCDSAINFVIKHDKKNHFLFASLQSDFAKEICKNYDVNPTALETMILIENGKIYTKSHAALRVNLNLNGLYPLLYGFIIIPPFIRDAVYNWISKNRYKWFGKKDNCMIPDDKIKKKFISF